MKLKYPLDTVGKIPYTSIMIIQINVMTEQISNALISALEGGSNYWYMIEKEIAPTKWVYENDGGERFNKEGKHWIQDYPLNPGGALIFSVSEELNEDWPNGHKFRLSLPRIKQGLHTMASESPKHFMDLVTDNGDGETGDVFLQYCLFGQIIYG